MSRRSPRLEVRPGLPPFQDTGLLNSLIVVGIRAVVAHQVHHVILNVVGGERSERINSDPHDRDPLCLFKKFKKDFDVAYITENSAGRLVLGDKIFVGKAPDEHRKIYSEIVDLFQYTYIFFIAICFHKY